MQLRNVYCIYLSNFILEEKIDIFTSEVRLQASNFVKL